MNIKIKLIKSFTQDPSQGAPTAVIAQADQLSLQQMIAIVKHYGFSECVFLQKSNKAHIRTRFFTQQQEVDYCGHATLAAFHVMSQGKNGVFLQETNNGILQVTCCDGLIKMQQSEPVISDIILDASDIGSLLTISSRDICGPCVTISTGTPKIIVPVNSLSALFAIKPKLEAIKAYCLQVGARGIYPFTQETISPDSHFHARQFNPLVGIDEDPVTGVAAAALGVYNNIYNLQPGSSCIVEQGYIMNKFGKIYVDSAEGIHISGYATSFGEEELSF